MDTIKFIIPLGYQNNKIVIKSNLKTDLELISGDNPLYEKLFKANNEFEKKLIDQHSSWFSNDKGYLRDTQKVIKGNLPPVCEYNNVMELKKKNVTHEILSEKFNYIEWKNLRFANKNSQIMQVYSLYNISSPILFKFRSYLCIFA